MDKLAGELPGLTSSIEARARSGGSREVSLRLMIDRHVLPRLGGRYPRSLLRDHFSDGLTPEIGRLAELALAGADEAAMALIARLHAQGAGFSRLQLGLIAPAARQLDVIWAKDDATFVEVTAAASLLKRLMHFVALDLAPRPCRERRQRTALIAPSPGDGHNLGAALVAEFFRRDGWAVRHEPRLDAETARYLVAAEWCDLAALSLTRSEGAASLARAIADMRRSSLNPRLVIVVGGDAIQRQPSLVAGLGADAALAPLVSAPLRAFRLVQARGA
jgi:methanogenic corrinoid protein MtbC1